MTFESLLDSKDNKPISPKGNQLWIFIWRTDAEAEAAILGPPDAKSWLTGKDPDAGKDWRQEEKGATDDVMVRWHHQLDGHESEQTAGNGEGQGTLACWGCMSLWGHKESDNMTLAIEQQQDEQKKRKLKITSFPEITVSMIWHGLQLLSYTYIQLS